jgi:predicted DsbA family dithiol-disulfide isomerase
METIRIRVHYDFASTLCYVAHRVMERMEPELDMLGIALLWTPLDLTGIAPFRRGVEIPPVRRANAARVAEELSVPVRIPTVWPDSRALGATVLLAEQEGRADSFRERAFSALHEEERAAESTTQVLGLARDLGLALEPEDVEASLADLEERTRAATEEGVTGVPTFMLGAWPFGGIQTEDTMRHVLTRYAGKARAGELV